MTTTFVPKPITHQEQLANRQNWIDALRNGKYEQAKHQLRGSQGYCCLGVAATVCGLPEDVSFNFRSLVTNEWLKPTLPIPDLVYLFGLTYESAIFLRETLVRLNDAFSVDFSNIARIAEMYFFLNPPCQQL
jgi:hypothetical protein